MKVHRGRLIDRVRIHVSDYPASMRFYATILDVLGVPATADDERLIADELCIEAGDQPSRIRLAFVAADRDVVDRLFIEGLAAGGRDERAPGERDDHPGCYACTLLDPDGNGVEAVHHGGVEPVGASVTAEAPDPVADEVA